MTIPLFKVKEVGNIGAKINELFETGKVAHGEYVTKFEVMLGAYIGSKFTIATSEMSSSIAMCLYVSGVRPGDEVLMSPLVCLATSCPVKNIFANIVWCDVNPKTGNLDPDDIARKITPKTKALILYHWAGDPSDLEKIYAIASRYNIKVIEDANEALGAEYNGKKIGNTGADFTIFSFYPIRQLTTIEGGAITCKTEEDYKRLLKLRRYGINQETFRLSDGEINLQSDIEEAGWNSYMSNISAMIGCSQFDTLDEVIKKHQANGFYYDAELQKLSGVELLIRPKNSISAYWFYTFLCDKKDELMLFLKENGISSSAVHIRNDIYSCFGETNYTLKGVDYFSKRAISIPCGWWLTREECECVVQKIEQFLKLNR
jgi:dTDP-4-amino-4,6-dideoxygalactose transaminase